MIWHWKIAETLSRKFKQQFKQLCPLLLSCVFFWKTSLLILAYKCDIYGRVFSRPFSTLVIINLEMQSLCIIVIHFTQNSKSVYEMRWLRGHKAQCKYITISIRFWCVWAKCGVAEQTFEFSKLHFLEFDSFINLLIPSVH